MKISHANVKLLTIVLFIAFCFWGHLVVAAEEKVTIYTVNYPLAYMAERIGGDLATVVFPAPPEVDPAYWTPDISSIINYQKADLILINGANYAEWLTKVSLPKSRIVNTSKQVKDSYIPLEGVLTHNHGPEGDHSHEGVAFTLWLDFQIASKQAESIATAMSRKIPDKHSIIDANLAKLQDDLLQLDTDLLSLGKAFGTTPIIGSHPVYQYLANRYGFNIRSVHWEPDQHPTGGQIKELEELLAQHPAAIMIWEASPIDSIRELLKNSGVKPVVFNPSGNRPGDKTFLEVMHQNVKSLENAR